MTLNAETTTRRLATAMEHAKRDGEVMLDDGIAAKEPCRNAAHVRGILETR